jgi:hypothetical protein
MKFQILLAMLALGSFAAAASAQMKFEIREQCGRPTAEYTIQAGDHEGHAFRIQQTLCTPDGAFEIAGVAIKEHKATGFSEMDVGNGSNRWFHVFTMASGDTIYARSEGTANYQGRRYQSSTAWWTFEGGTGKFEKLSGRGTSSCHPAPGGFACEAQGDYSLP